ncbi:MAG: amidohydrolase [Saprospiraceae bacterium]|jgi:amidohydrolase|nr:amidohydrolase [Saprospiraceae bacterium]MBK6814597.1 amidohydrolase [Saprospiraceae bacterium]MBK8512261.1 amidohydrolase [Saprospiraceae bacterium]MBL0111738.1 amidohydrolase [Saprospiraceae bacterium]MBP7921435.1 amidohydrolase [Saprospiraceae bacterium]
MNIDEIKLLGEQIHPEVIEYRRHLHAHPELSFLEFNTSAYIKSQLDELGIPWKALANTGVVAMIKGSIPSEEVIALRADIDALPITETNEVIYKSTNDGVMHACGHDAHTASLLGVAKLLLKLRDKFGGTVKFIFQPGEEKLPGGASIMIKEGVLENPEPQSILGQHVLPIIPCGKIGIRKGKFMASMDEILVTVRGKGGHAAQPHQVIDPLVITSHIILALQQIVSRMANPLSPSVLSFGKLSADGAINVIPDEVTMAGTFRTLDEIWRAEAHVLMKNMAETIAESMGGSCQFQINKGYPYLINHDDLTDKVTRYASEYLGKENIMDLDIWMASEDFAYYSQAADACFYILGIGNVERGIDSSLHTPTFNIDEQALNIGPGLMTYIALKILGN